MELLKDKQPIALRFIITGLFLLLLALVFGLLGAFQYVITGLFRNGFSFEKVRPLHVSSAVFWILMGACGVVTHYLAEVKGKLYSARLSLWQWFLFSGAVLLILLSYVMGIFGGREYWEFHPVFAIPIVVAWVLFVLNVFKSVRVFRKQPVYVWMWMTGVVFFLFTYLESYLWLLPFFRSSLVSDMTLQWKSYGSMVGGWNMLIYGSGIYLMDKISGTDTYSHSKIGFALYFLGLFNLMFNWGHHIYTLPTPHFIQYISYLVSMTELLLLGRIIYKWRSSVSEARKHYHLLPYRFLLAADIWVLLTLLLAIAMSIPAVNRYTHGTHITVAHTMGATIGINTFMLLAFVCDIFKVQTTKLKKQLSFLLHCTLVVLFAFWLSLVLAGVLKADWQINHSSVPFSEMMRSLRPYFISFLISGFLLASLLAASIILLLRHCFNSCK